MVVRSRSAVSVLVVSTLLLLAGCGDSPEPEATVIATEPATEPSTETTTGSPTESPTTTSDTETPAGEPVDACELLNADIATEALGEDVVVGDIQAFDDCRWETADGARRASISRLSDSVEAWRGAHDGVGSFESVEGIGDEAYYGPVLTCLSFLVDGELLELDVELDGRGDPEETLTALAATVLGRR